MVRLALFVLLVAPTAAAQFTAGARTAQSDVHDVRAAAMGGAGAFLPDAAPLAFVQNPARLAEATAAPMLRVSLDGHPDYRSFGGGAGFGIGVGHLAATGTVGRVALGAVVSGLSETDTITNELGEAIGEIESGNRALAVGAAVRLGGGRLHADLGATGRVTQLRRGVGLDVNDADPVQTRTSPSLDLGATVTADVLPARSLPTGDVAPTLAVSAGYAQRSIGPAFQFSEDNGFFSRAEQPRTGSAGISVRLGLDAQYAGGRLRLATLDLAAEAEASLNSADFGDLETETTIDRAALTGPMRVRDALLGTSDNPLVEGQRGARLTIAESVWVAAGRYRGAYGDIGRYRTWGVGASVGGALRAVGLLTDDANLTDLGRRLDVTLGVARGRLTFSDAGIDARYRLFTLGIAAGL